MLKKNTQNNFFQVLIFNFDHFISFTIQNKTKCKFVYAKSFHKLFFAYLASKLFGLKKTSDFSSVIKAKVGGLQCF